MTRHISSDDPHLGQGVFGEQLAGLGPTLERLDQIPSRSMVVDFRFSLRSVRKRSKCDAVIWFNRRTPCLATVGDSRMLAATIEASGLGIEPDARLTGK